MKLTREERIQLTYQIGDIIEQKCRRCYYNRSDDASFSISKLPDWSRVTPVG